MITSSLHALDPSGKGILVAAQETAACILEYLEKTKLKAKNSRPKSPKTGTIREVSLSCRIFNPSSI